MLLKYIMVRGCPIIFDETQTHAEVAAGRDVDSAGFVIINADKDKILVECYGKSMSLGIKSKPAQDSNRIKRMFNPY